jgi:hypothetical protein
MFSYGAIRLLPVHTMHEHSVLAVTAGSSNLAEGVISLSEAQDLVRNGEAIWLGEQQSKGAPL